MGTRGPLNGEKGAPSNEMRSPSKRTHSHFFYVYRFISDMQQNIFIKNKTIYGKKLKINQIDIFICYSKIIFLAEHSKFSKPLIFASVS